MSLRKLPEIKAFEPSDLLRFKPPEEAEAEFNSEIRAARDDDEAVISLYGQIGRDFLTGVDNSERRVGAALKAIGKRDVTVQINSPGGNYFSGASIFNLLVRHPAKVTINVLGMAGSAASLITAAGDEVLMGDSAFIMVHRASAAIDEGNWYDLGDARSLVAEVDDAMAAVYAARAGVDKSVAAGWMDKDRGRGTMFGAKSAIEHGLAEGMMPAGAVKVAADSGKTIPLERLAERAFMQTYDLSAATAKARVAALKSGARDAAVNVTRDADIIAALERLRTTLRT